MGEDLMTISSIMGLGTVQESNSTFYIPDVINSRKLKLDIVNKKWKTEEFQDGVNLMKYWGFTKTNIMKDSLIHIASQPNRVIGETPSIIIEESSIASYSSDVSNPSNSSISSEYVGSDIGGLIIV